MLPDSTSRTRSASQSGSSVSSACAVVMKPGVQKPHCSAWCLRKDFCSGVRSSSFDRPSTVTTFAPSACTASIRQERTASPLTSTVQAPHTPCSQPTWVPVSRRWWRRQSASVRRGSTSTSTCFAVDFELVACDSSLTRSFPRKRNQRDASTDSLRPGPRFRGDERRDVDAVMNAALLARARERAVSARR